MICCGAVSLDDDFDDGTEVLVGCMWEELIFHQLVQRFYAVVGVDSCQNEIGFFGIPAEV